MPTTRKSYPPTLKAKVAVEAIKGRKTTSQIAQIYRVHPNLVGKWKQAALAKLPEVFRQPNQKAGPADAEKAELYEQIGRLSVELDWLKKRSELVG